MLLEKRFMTRIVLVTAKTEVFALVADLLQGKELVIIPV